jgi:hypothetical protein
MVLVFVNRNYHWTLRPFAHQFNKYWGDGPEDDWFRVLVVSEVKPAFDLPDNFEYKRVPAFSEGEWPVEYYSTGIASQLKEMNDQVVTILMPDHWLIEPVDVTQVNAMRGYLIDHPDVVKVGLKAQCSIIQSGVVAETFAGVDMMYCPKGNTHCQLDGGTALALGHWHRERLSQLLDSANWSPWQIETLGTQRMLREQPTWYSVGTRPGLVDYQDGVRHGQSLVYLDKLNEQDREEVKALLPKGTNIRE